MSRRTAGLSARFVGPSASPAHWFARLALLATVGPIASGCRGCREERPFTPYVLDAASTAPSAAHPPTPPSASAPPTLPPAAEIVVAARLDPPVREVAALGRSIEVPTHRVAELLVERDLNGDLRTDALLLLQALPTAPPAQPRRELWFFPDGDDAKSVFALPGWVPTAPTCTHATKLAVHDGRLVMLDIHARCQPRVPERVPTRLLALLDRPPATRVLLGLRLAEPAASETLDVRMSMVDRDGDDRRDLALDVELGVDGATEVLSLGWLDRAAGYAFEPSLFVETLTRRLGELDALARDRARSLELASRVAHLRRLLTAVCQQSGTSRLWDWDGREIACPELDRVGLRLAQLDVRAALNRGDRLAAAGAYGDGLAWFGGLPKAERESLRKVVESGLSEVTPKGLVEVTARPPKQLPTARFSPLSFDAEGRLSILTDSATLVRVARDGLATTLDRPSQHSADLSVTDGVAKTLVRLLPGCDRSELLFVVGGAKRLALLPPIPTGLLSPRPGSCRGNPIELRFAPLEWLGEVPVGLTNGRCTHPTDPGFCTDPKSLGATRPGSPRSPDGQSLVAVTPLGLLVHRAAKTERWNSEGLGDTATLTDCVVANGAQALACLRGDQVIFVTREQVPKAEVLDAGTPPPPRDGGEAGEDGGAPKVPVS